MTWPIKMIDLLIDSRIKYKNGRSALNSGSNDNEQPSKRIALKWTNFKLFHRNLDSLWCRNVSMRKWHGPTENRSHVLFGNSSILSMAFYWILQTQNMEWNARAQFDQWQCCEFTVFFGRVRWKWWCWCWYHEWNIQMGGQLGSPGQMTLKSIRRQ